MSESQSLEKPTKNNQGIGKTLTHSRLISILKSQSPEETTDSTEESIEEPTVDEELAGIKKLSNTEIRRRIKFIEEAGSEQDFSPIQTERDKFVPDSVFSSYLFLSSFFLPVYQFGRNVLPDIPLPLPLPVGATATPPTPSSEISSAERSGLEQQRYSDSTAPPVSASEPIFGSNTVEQDFLQAIHAYDIKKVQAYLSRPDIRQRLNAVDAKGDSPLIHAARIDAKRNQNTLTAELIKKGANIESQTADGQTALLIAATHGSRNLIDCLGYYNANFSHRDHLNQDAETIARKKKKSEAASLIQSYQRFHSLTEHLKEKNTKEAAKDIDYFARVGAINYRFAHGNTLLMTAAQFDDAIIIKKLVTKGAEVDATLPGHLTPLQIASYFGKEAAVEQLLAHKANVNIAAPPERLPLTYAVRQGHHSIAEMLLSNGPNVHTQIAGRGNLLTIASLAGDARMVKILLQHGAKDKNNLILRAAIQQHHQEVVDVLLGVDKRKGQTALMRAAERGDQDIFSALVDAGADLTATDRNGENVGDYARRGKMYDLYTQKTAATAKPNTAASILEAIASILVVALPIIYCLPQRRRTLPVEEEKHPSAHRKKHR